MHTSTGRPAVARLAVGARLGGLTGSGWPIMAFAQEKPTEGRPDRTILPIREPRRQP